MGILWWLSLPLHISELHRVRQILGVLARHGFEDISIRLSGVRLLRWLFKPGPQAHRIPIERRLRIVLEELGPTFVKLGQVMATRPDILPMNVINELQKLHDDVPPVPFSEVRTLIESELGMPLEKAFKEVVAQSIASASIAQVYRATLHDGQEVVIKVQRPNAEEVVKADMRILQVLAEALEKRIPELRRFRPRQILKEFANTISDEMDFLIEMENLLKYRENFKDEEGLHIPRPFEELCTKRVLVMEAVKGTKITDVRTLRAKGIDLRKVLEVGMRVTLRSIFEFGFFHADPHPGNFFVEDDGRIALIDFGMVGVLDDDRIDDMLVFLASMVTGDTEGLVKLLLELDLVPDEVDLRQLKMELGRLLVRYRNVEIGKLDTAQFLSRVYEVMSRYNVVLPADLMLVGKAIATLEGIGRQVYPEFNPIDELKPYITNLYAERILNPQRQASKVINTITDTLSLLRDAPYDIRRILHKARAGEFRIQVDEPHLVESTEMKVKAMNRLLYGGLSMGYGLMGILGKSLLDSSLVEWGSFAVSAIFFIMLVYSLLASD